MFVAYSPFDMLRANGMISQGSKIMIKKLTSKSLLYALVPLSLLIAACGADKRTVDVQTTIDIGFHGTERTDGFTPTDFSLIDQNQGEFTLSEQRGDLVMLFFGYTHCPDFCPFTLNTWQQVQTKLGVEADEVEFVYVTLDPKRDTPEVIDRHLTYYDPRFIGLTGDEEYLQAIYEEFEVEKRIVPSGSSDLSYLIAHSVNIFLLDHEGVVRVQYVFQDGPEMMEHDIRMLLEERT